MSVIIKGIDLPKENITTAKVAISYLDPNQVIQIPKGHGALIDVTNLVNMLSKKLDLIARERNSRSKSARLSLIRDLAIELHKEPTILESEER